MIPCDVVTLELSDGKLDVCRHKWETVRQEIPNDVEISEQTTKDISLFCTFVDSSETEKPLDELTSCEQLCALIRICADFHSQSLLLRLQKTDFVKAFPNFTLSQRIDVFKSAYQVREVYPELLSAAERLCLASYDIKNDFEFSNAISYPDESTIHLFKVRAEFFAKMGYLKSAVYYARPGWVAPSKETKTPPSESDVAALSNYDLINYQIGSCKFELTIKRPAGRLVTYSRGLANFFNWSDSEKESAKIGWQIKLDTSGWCATFTKVSRT